MYQPEFDQELKELEKEGFIVRCSEIPHNQQMLNPDYTFVTNDDKGRELALNRALFTRTCI
jgi:hypothetical protein